MRFKLNFLLLLLVTAVLLVSSAFFYYSLRNELDAQFEERKQEIAKRLQVNLVNAIWNYDREQAVSIIDFEFDSSPDISEISVFQTAQGSGAALENLFVFRNREGAAPRAGEEASETKSEDTMRVPLKVVFRTTPDGPEKQQDVEVGYTQIRFSRYRVEELLAEQLRNRIIEILILNAVLGFALYSVMSRMVIGPLAQLSRAFKELAQNPQVGELKIKGHDEFGEVVDAFNHIERRLVSDIESRTEAEKSLRETNKELNEAMDSLKLAQESLVQSEKFAALGALVAGVAHEINTPVGITVTGASFLIEEGQRIEKLMNQGNIKKSEIVQFVASVLEGSRLVLNNAERAAYLINSFKQVAADETSEMRRTFDLKDYLNEVLTSLRPMYKKTAISVRVSCPENVEMDTYPGLLAQVLTNLVSNALTHGFDAGAEGEIAIVVGVDAKWVVIECINNGKIIPPESIPRLFEPFFTTRRSAGGTGLGLNIVSNIVTQRLGGTVKVVSEAGQGTVFTVRIPMVLAERVHGRSKK